MYYTFSNAPLSGAALIETQRERCHYPAEELSPLKMHSFTLIGSPS